MQSKKIVTFSVGIPAYNEEKNIGLLLGDVIKQKKINGYLLDEVIVLSDKSEDETDKIVTNIAKKNPFVKLIRNKSRIGKSYSLNKVIKNTKSDILVLFDADIRLKKNTLFELLKPFQWPSISLVAGNPVPFKPSDLFNISEQAAFFSHILLREIKTNEKNTIYMAHGRILALSKKLYKRINFRKLTTPGDDQYIYLTNKRLYKEKSFGYASEAQVLFKLPRTLKDHLKQSVRFRLSKINKSILYSRKYIHQEFKVQKIISYFLSSFSRYPYQACTWLFLYIWGELIFIFTKKRGFSKLSSAWEVSKSTK